MHIVKSPKVIGSQYICDSRKKKGTTRKWQIENTKIATKEGSDHKRVCLN